MSKKLESTTVSWEELISIENLFAAWEEFRKGKRKRIDVQTFEMRLEDNLFLLNQKLQNKTYQHGSYKEFYVQDPKIRHIHKASVKDRVVHHLLYKFLYQLFDSTFIYDSYSCRLGKGTHKGVRRLEFFARKVSNNYTGSCWALKCDTKRFFANVYLDRLDQFVKNELKIKYYLRYADDFVFLAKDKSNLEHLITPIRHFLQGNLKLELHPKKIVFRKLDWGIDFLGYVVLPYYRLPRTRTRRRIPHKLKERFNSDSFEQSVQSYLGYLSHASSYKFTKLLLASCISTSVRATIQSTC